MRSCKVCKSDISGLDARRIRCTSVQCTKSSNREKSKLFRERNPRRNIDAIKRYSTSERGRAVLLLNNARDRARRGGLQISIDLDFVIEKLKLGKCELTGIEYQFELAGKYKANPLGPSIDRIVPALGYTKENVRMVCFGVNVMHHDWSDELMLRLSEKIVENKHRLYL